MNFSEGTRRTNQTSGGNGHGNGIGGNRSVKFSVETGHTDQTPGGNSHGGG